MRRISRLDRDEVLELRDNKSATAQSAAVLVFAALSIGIGSTLKGEIHNNDVSPYGIIVGGLVGIVTGCFAAFVWSGTLYLVGTKLFQGKTGYWELARPMFFSASPALLFVLISIPVPIFYGSVAIILSAWIVLLQGFVLKQVMQFDNRRTILTLAVGFLILIFIELQFS